MRIRSLLIAGALAVTLAPAPAVAEPLITQAPPCIHEDGAGQTLCVWNAKARGNGKGRSYFQATEGPDRYIEITHRKARKMVRRWRATSCVKVTRRDYVCRGWNRG